MPVKTTIDANAPILMQWIVSDPDRFNKEVEPGKYRSPAKIRKQYKKREKDIK